MTDRASYSGLCIDGPLAGTWVTHSIPWYKTAEHPPLDISAPLDAVPHPDRATVTVKVHEYKWIIGFRHRKDGAWTEDVLNFWIPKDKEWTPLDCVKMMAEDYANYHDLRNS
jgi:hypothetical protein